MDGVLTAFEKQIAWCQTLGSPFMARLLALLVGDIAAGGPTASLVADWPGDATADAVPLRLAAALHALVLEGSEAGLARCYPPAAPRDEELGSAARDVVVRRTTFIRDFMRSPPQTNEVGRSGVLVGGFLHIAKVTGRPLTVLEIGASAGLNLCWDRYRYRLGAGRWGDPGSAVDLAPDWAGASPPLEARLQVTGRRGCDLAPTDLEDPAQRLRLRAYVWADQTQRLGRLGAAMEAARAAGIRVEQADAAAWTEARLREAGTGTATVLYHSIMWQYMSPATQARIVEALEERGAAATAESPLAWLRFEPAPGAGDFELRVRLWPGARDERLATAHPHGSAVTWLG